MGVTERLSLGRFGLASCAAGLAVALGYVVARVLA